MFPRNENRNKGTFAKTTLLRNCGCFGGPFGASPGKLRESPGKIAGKFFPTNSRISGIGKGKPAGNLGSTLPGPCPYLPCGVFFEIDSSSLLECFFGVLWA